MVSRFPNEKDALHSPRMPQKQDATTYRVTQVNPYRFKEVTDPAGKDSVRLLNSSVRSPRNPRLFNYYANNRP